MRLFITWETIEMRQSTSQLITAHRHRRTWHSRDILIRKIDGTPDISKWLASRAVHWFMQTKKINDNYFLWLIASCRLWPSDARVVVSYLISYLQAETRIIPFHVRNEPKQRRIMWQTIPFYPWCIFRWHLHGNWLQCSSRRCHELKQWPK